MNSGRKLKRPSSTWTTNRQTTQSEIILWTFDDFGVQAHDITSDYCGTNPLIIMGPCRVYCGMLPTIRPIIYSCLRWDDPTQSSFNAGSSHALCWPFPSINPRNNAGFHSDIPALVNVRLLWAEPICYIGLFPVYIHK